MNAVYHDTHKLSAGILALVVHGVFFTLLYFGFTWQSQRPASMNVELWQSLPDQVVAQPLRQPELLPPPVKPPEVKPVEPPPVLKPEITIPIKKPEPKPEKPVEKKVIESKPLVDKVKPDPKKIVGKTQPKPAEPSIAEQQAAREIAEQAALLGRTLDEYTAKIITKIRNNIAGVRDVPSNASVEFDVTLLPGGYVLSARRTQSSGNLVYETAVERAILKSQPLPLPPDPNMFNRFRELKLKFKPVE